MLTVRCDIMASRLVLVMRVGRATAFTVWTSMNVFWKTPAVEGPGVKTHWGVTAVCVKLEWSPMEVCALMWTNVKKDWLNVPGVTHPYASTLSALSNVDVDLASMVTRIVLWDA